MPGAGGATAATYLYRIAPKDGTTIASVSPNAILGKLLDDGQTPVRSDASSIISRAPSAARACA